MPNRRPTPLSCTAAVCAAALAVGLGPAAASAPAPAPAGTTTQLRPGWGLDRIDERARPLDGKYRARVTGAGVTAYVVDGGMDHANAEFGGRASLGVDLVDGSDGGCPDELGVDHGTFVGGIIGGRTTGVAKGVRLVAVRAIKCGEGSEPLPEWKQRALVVRAVDWVRTHATRPAVVNMSLNLRSPYSPLTTALQRLERAGIPVVVSAGNDGGDACSRPPANVPSALVVGASTSADRPWSGSNHGRCVDLYAPGLSVKSVASGGGTFWYAGSGATSWAAPFVTGTAALYLSARPTATPAQVRSWILRNATTGRLSGLRPQTPNRLLHSFALLGS